MKGGALRAGDSHADDRVVWRDNFVEVYQRSHGDVT